MLGIHGVGRDKADYYLSDLARELPVAGPGRWAGNAAAGPRAGRTRRARRLPAAAPGPASAAPGWRSDRGGSRWRPIDLTFSAPKSASVLFALGGPTWRARWSTVHAEAVAGSLSYLEQHGITATRRSGADRAVLPTTGGGRRGVHARGQPQR